jgi:hypothetical protein
MIKKITTLVNTNRRAIVRKSLVVGGIAFGVVAGALLAKPETAFTLEDEKVETTETI